MLDLTNRVYYRRVTTEPNNANDAGSSSGNITPAFVSAKSNPENAPLLTSETGLRVIEAFRLKIMNREGASSAAEFKQIVNEVKVETKAKGPELYHPIRIALTGSHSGPEFDKLVPLIEEGSRLSLPTPIPSVRDRIAQFVAS